MKLEKELYINEYEFNGNDDWDYIILRGAFKNNEREIIRKNFGNKIKLTLEVEEPILDEEERKYLSGVIRPFRDEIKYIERTEDSRGKEYIYIQFKDDDNMMFKSFEKNLMYKGMELNKEYTLEELGL